MEAKYIALLESLQHVIPLMSLHNKCVRRGLIKVKSKPVVRCTVFKDNSGALELARTPKLRPCTKHINVKYHHFREHVANGRITVEPVKSENQLADVFTKAVAMDLFLKFRKAIMGW